MMGRKIEATVLLTVCILLIVGILYQRQLNDVDDIEASDTTTFGSNELNFTPFKKPRILPKFTFKNSQGDTLSLDDFRNQIVLLNIWATWCGPCREEMPTLDRLQTKLGGTDFQVLALSIDIEGKDVIEPFYKSLGLTALKIYTDQNDQSSRALKILGIPTTLLIDRQGREIGRVLGPAEWDSEAAVTIIRHYLDTSSIKKGETDP